MAKQGHFLIIDEVIWRKQIFSFYLEEFFNISPIYLIKIKCDLVSAIAREKNREDRFLGLARGLKKVEKNISFYDLELDTTQTSQSENAEKILKFIYKNPFPQAFQKAKLVNKT